jgi:membrane protein
VAGEQVDEDVEQTNDRAGDGAPIPKNPSAPGKVMLLAKRVSSRRGVKHLIRAVTRYAERLGSQFAGAMTYFSFLSLVPILMVAFAVAGIVLGKNEELLLKLQEQITAAVPGDLADPLNNLITSVVNNPLAVGIPGLLIALYSGIGWMGNLRKAMRAIWRPSFDKDIQAKENFFLATAKDLGSLGGLGLAIAVSLGLSAFGVQFQTAFLNWVGLGDVSWLVPVTTVTAILIAVAADVLIFLWVYTILPGKELRSPLKARVRGSILAALAFEILKYALTTLVPGIATGSATAAIFGPVIGLLFFFNLTAQVVLFVAAWIATADGSPTEEDLDDDQGELEEVPEATVVVRKDMSAGKAAAILGAGAAAGGFLARRRR